MDFDPQNNRGSQQGAGVSSAPADYGAGVRFEDNGWKAMKYYRESATPKLIRWVMKYSGGLIKDEKQAGYFLMGLSLAVLVLGLILMFSGGPELTPVPPPPTPF